MKSYILTGIIFLTVFFFQYKQDKDTNEIIENGITEKVIILSKNLDCTNSTRNRNKVIVKTENSFKFNIPITYNDCLELNKGDSILIRFLDENSKALRVYDLNKPTKKSNYFKYIFMIVSLVFLFAPFYKKRKETV